MSAKQTCYYSADGPNQEAVSAGIRWLTTISGSEVYLAVMINDILRRGYLCSTLGDTTVKTLIQSRSVRFGPKTITLVTKKREIRNGNGRPILVMYPNKDFIDELDSIPNVSAMMIVPWRLEDIVEWASTWGANDLNPQPLRQHTQVTQVSRVVESALNSMIASVNEANGVGGSGKDRNVCVETFKILRNNGETFEPSAIKSWLIRHGWRATTAEDAAQIARDILDGKGLRSKPWYNSNIIDLWRS